MSIKAVNWSTRSRLFCLHGQPLVPSYLGRWAASAQNRNEPQVHRTINAMSPFDSVSRDRLSSIGFRSVHLRTNVL